MRALLAPLLIVGLGCTTFSIEDPATGQTIKGMAYGRSALSVETNEDGETEIIICQDGVTDWIGGRLASSIGQIAGQTPFIGAAPGSGKLEGPSPASACQQIMEGSADPEPPEVKPETIELDADTTIGDLVGSGFPSPPDE